MRLGQPLAALLERRASIGGDQPLAGFDQRRQRRFGVGRDRDVDLRIALEVLVVALRRQDRRAVMLISFVPGLTSDRDVRVQPVADGVDGAPEVGQLEAEDDVGVGDELPRAARSD